MSNSLFPQILGHRKRSSLPVFYPAFFLLFSFLTGKYCRFCSVDVGNHRRLLYSRRPNSGFLNLHLPTSLFTSCSGPTLSTSSLQLFQYGEDLYGTLTNVKIGSCDALKQVRRRQTLAKRNYSSRADVSSAATFGNISRL